MGKDKSIKYCPCGRQASFYRGRKGLQYICISPNCKIPQPEPKQTREEAEKAWNERCENAERNL